MPRCLRLLLPIAILFTAEFNKISPENVGKVNVGIQDQVSPDILKTPLDPKTSRLLLSEIDRLFLDGYGWDHQYTQCVIKQILYTHQLGVDYDPGLCSRLLKLTIPNIPPELAIALTYQSPSEDELAKVEFNPSEDESPFANEVYLPSERYLKTIKRSLAAIDDNRYEYMKALASEAERLIQESKLNLVDRLVDKAISSSDKRLLGDKRPQRGGVSEWEPVDNDDVRDADELGKSIINQQLAAGDGDSDSEEDKPQFLQLYDEWNDIKPVDNDYESNFWRQIVDLDTDESDDNSNEVSNVGSFPRQYRLDTKKPGPGYYIHETDAIGNDIRQPQLLKESHSQVTGQPLGLNEFSDGDTNSRQTNEDVRGKSSLEHVYHGDPTAARNNLGDKRDGMAYKPVSEGPVKVDSGSKDNLVVRPAEEGEKTNLEAIDSSYTYLVVDKEFGSVGEAHKFVETLQQLLRLPRGTFSNVRKEKAQVTFKVNPNRNGLNASEIAARIEELTEPVKQQSGFLVRESGIGDKAKLEVVSTEITHASDHRLALITISLCGVILTSLLAGGFVFFIRRNAKFREKIKGLTGGQPDAEASQDYQDLCRQRMQSKSKEKPEQIQVAPTTGTGVHKLAGKLTQQSTDGAQPSPPSRSSTSSWSEEPVSSNMDISTGHMILSYMEDHLKNKDRLDREWEALCAYEADPCSTNAAHLPQNAKKNRYQDVLPYDHSRVILNDLANVSGCDYINANTITDHDPRNPAYIATIGPLADTAADFWQMVWEQGSVIIVMLTRLMENGVSMCHRYWPEEGSEVYHTYEVHLVSEHIWCDDYLVRSFYLKNLKTSETRTVTQFHFLSWPRNEVPPNAKSILEFRRKVNKSFRGRSCPIVVHCSDGASRTGTYILIDMVLNRMAKGAKEIDIAATLEHIRDQRMGMVKTKAQFEYVLTTIAEEVHAILKVLSQN